MALEYTYPRAVDLGSCKVKKSKVTVDLYTVAKRF